MSKDNIIAHCNAIASYLDRHPGVPIVALVSLAVLFGINEIANHDAMEHGYDRNLKVLGVSSSVTKSRVTMSNNRSYKEYKI